MSGFRARHAEAKVHLERNEVLVVMQTRQAIFNASRCNDRIDRLAHRNVLGAKQAKISGRFHCNIVTGKIDSSESIEGLPQEIELPVILHALQYLGHDQVANRRGMRPNIPSRNSTWGVSVPRK